MMCRHVAISMSGAWDTMIGPGYKLKYVNYYLHLLGCDWEATNEDEDARVDGSSVM